MATQITATLPALDFPKEVDYPTQEDWAAFSADAELNYGILSNEWSDEMALFASEANQLAIEVENNALSAQGAGNYQGDWTSKGYNLGQSVTVSGVFYVCKLTHATGQNPTVGGSLYWVINNRENQKGTNIASATTTTIGTAGLGDYIHITGTTAITSFGTAANAGLRRTLIFDGIVTITNGANLICVGGANIVTVANTIVSVIAETTTQWRVEYVIHPSVSFAELGYLDGVTSSIQAQINAKANLDSPAFTNNPTAPTQTAGNNSTRLATTGYVDIKFTRGTAVSTTSGTAIDFTGIPSWAKRITVLFNQVGINNSDKILLRVGSGSIVTTGYVSVCSALYSAGDGVGNGIGTNTTGFLFDTNDGAFALSGSVEIFNLSGNLYVSNGNIGSVSGSGTPINQLQTGAITLSGALDRIRLTTVSGTAVFDSGSINIMYEG